MANSARNTPGVERPIIEAEEINPLDNIQLAYEKNKNTLTTILVALVVVVGGYFVYTKMYKGPQEEKAFTQLSMPQLYFQADSLNMALNGDGKNPGFVKIQKNNSGTAAGNLALYYEGISYLKIGDYPKAIKALSEFDGKGTILGSQAAGSLGIAYMESGNTAKAIESFKKATANKEDVLVTPMYLYQLGMAYEASGNNKDAIDAFKRIRDEYPRSINARDMDKELARLGQVD